MFSILSKIFSPVIIILDFVTKYFKTVVFLTILYFIFFNGNNISRDSSGKANLQRIDLSGPILNISSVLEKIEEAKNDKNIKGVLFVVDSPGGSVAPSVELAYAIKNLKNEKPVVVYASGTITSGSYYASIWANEIIANPGSIVGSIGVIMQGFNAKNLMDKIGIEAQTIKAGMYKDSGTYNRKWNKDEEQQLQNVINGTYKMFINDVANARNINIEDYKNFADGKIFTSQQAKELGLVDEVASISFAKNSLIKLAKIDEAIWKKQDKLDIFIEKITSEVISKISMSLSSSLKAY